LASYRELKVWQRAIELSVVIYKLTGGLPKEEMYGLSSQLRRSAVSVASNIAEGYGRSSKGEFRQFLGIARGSVLELQTQLVIVGRLNWGEISELETANSLSEEVGKMLWSLQKKI
jgi:four helix bundle protein